MYYLEYFHYIENWNEFVSVRRNTILDDNLMYNFLLKIYENILLINHWHNFLKLYKRYFNFKRYSIPYFTSKINDDRMMKIED